MAPSSNRLRIRSHSEAGTTVVVPVGVFDSTTYGTMRDHLLKCAVDQPQAVVVDLSGVEVGSVSALTVFSSVAAEVSDWPGVPIHVVSAPEGPVPPNSAIRRFVVVHETVAAAVAAQQTGPERTAARLELPNDHAALMSARRFTAATCRDWRADGVGEDATFIASELVQNTLQHTLSAAVLGLELRCGLLSVAVYDDSPKLPALRSPGVSAPGGYGLVFVSRVSLAWGSAPTTGGGKVVWATLRL